MAWIWPGEKKGVAASSWIRLEEKKGGHTPSWIRRHAVSSLSRLARLARMESMETSGVGMGRCEDKGVDMGGADSQPPLSYFFSHLTNKPS